MPAKIDLTGKQFGRWTVLYEDVEIDAPGAHWVCQCSCPEQTIRTVKGQSLRDGRSQSCGCLHRELAGKPHFKDLIGQKFGKLTVIQRDPTIHPDEAYWICQCDCGTITKPIRGTALRNGHTASCGCLRSKGEEKIAQFLTKYNEPFIREYTFEDLKNPMTNRLLRFDFFLPERNCCIEFNGIQHYENTDWYGKDVLEEIQMRDKIKIDYCNSHDLLLITISYQDFSKIEEILKKELEL